MANDGLLVVRDSQPAPRSARRDAGSDAASSATLTVPGARLYYEIQGAGPLLLLIPGGPADAGVFADLAGGLADRYTVVAYDPRGNSRSTLDGPPEDQRLDVHGDDAARLIEALGGGLAYVFGTSGGAQIGLNLAARHPQQVRVLVAHEPPCLMMLEDSSQALANNSDVHDTYRRAGARVAMQQFMSMNGMAGRPNRNAPPVPATAAGIETFGRIEKNFEYFLAHGLLPLSLYRPDVDALRANRTSVVLGIGELTAGETANRTAVALAAKLGIEPLLFPGDHIGYGPHAEAFGVVLHQALAGQRQ